jgi:hypothetical protein
VNVPPVLFLNYLFRIAATGTGNQLFVRFDSFINLLSALYPDRSLDNTNNNKEYRYFDNFNIIVEIPVF